MSSTTINGKPQRKQLSDQLDRFDAILDGLAEGLNDAIADAVRDGTRLALKDALVEILTDPTLRTKLQQAAAPPVPVAAPVAPKPSFWSRIKLAAAGAVSAASNAVSKVAQAGIQLAAGAVNVVKNPSRLVQLVANVKPLLTAGAIAGVAILASSILAPTLFSAVVSALTGAAAAMAVQTSNWTRRTFLGVSKA